MPGVVERFLKDKRAVDRIRKTFAGLFSLDEVRIFMYSFLLYINFDFVGNEFQEDFRWIIFSWRCKDINVSCLS